MNFENLESKKAEDVKIAEAIENPNSIREMSKKYHLLCTFCRVGDFENAHKIKDSLPGEYLEQENVQEDISEAVREGIVGCIRTIRLDDMLAIKGLFDNIKDEEIIGFEGYEEAVEEGLSSVARRGHLEEIYRAIDILKPKREFTRSKGFKEYLVAGILKQLDRGDWDDISETMVGFDIPDSYLKKPNFQKQAEDAIKEFMKVKSADDLKFIKEIFGLKSVVLGDSIELQYDNHENNNDIAIDTAKKENSEEIIAEVLEGGGFRLHMCFENPEDVKDGLGKNPGQRFVESGVSGLYRHNANSLGDMWWSMKDSTKSETLESFMQSRNINEIVDVRHVKEELYEKDIIKGKKGFMGIGKIPDREEKRFVGLRQCMHDELVEGGKKEPAVRIFYYVQRHDWRSKNDGRTGQHMSMEILVPESMAEEILQEIKSNPNFIRSLNEKVVKGKMLEKPNAWDGPSGYDKLKPPYEKWDIEGGRLYMQTEDMSGWHEECAIKMAK